MQFETYKFKIHDYTTDSNDYWHLNLTKIPMAKLHAPDRVRRWFQWANSVL